MGLRFVNGSVGCGLNRLKIVERPVVGPVIIKREFKRLDRDIRIAERDFILSQSPTSFNFNTEGPNRPIFFSTPPKSFMKFVTEMKFNRNAHFAELGSGSGRIGLRASYYFENVTLFETDKRLCNITRRIMREYSISNVTLKNADFLRQSIEPFDYIFFFLPFRDNYTEKMKELVQRAKPGSTLIFTSEQEFQLFGPEHFTFTYPAAGDLPTPRRGLIIKNRRSAIFLLSNGSNIRQ